MGKLILAGLGTSKNDITLKLIEKAKECDKIYLELYTSVIPDLKKEELEKTFGKKIDILERSGLEEKSHEIIEEAKEKNIMILIPGDPLLFTTHQSLLIEAKKNGIKTEIVHGVSIYSSAISESGLQASKFGRSVTLPSRFNEEEYNHIFNDIEENRKRGLHSLILLELDLSSKRALERLGSKFGKEIKILVLSKLGSDDEIKKYGKIEDLAKEDFFPPLVFIIPGKLHFEEERFLDCF